MAIDSRLIDWDGADESRITENFNRVLAIIDAITNPEAENSLANKIATLETVVGDSTDGLVADVADHETRITALEGE